MSNQLNNNTREHDHNHGVGRVSTWQSEACGSEDPSSLPISNKYQLQPHHKTMTAADRVAGKTF